MTSLGLSVFVPAGRALAFDDLQLFCDVQLLVFDACMRTNIDIDDALLMEAERLTGIGTKRELIDRALRLLVEVLRRKPLGELRGRIRFADGFDHKALRERARRSAAGRP